MTRLQTERLLLAELTLPLVEAIMHDRRDEAEALIGAKLPDKWPNHALIERAFTVSLDRIRSDPDRRLWGDHVIVSREREPRVLGSVIFHGRPDADGIAEVAYGVEEGSQGQGIATEATLACVSWALSEPYVSAVQATTALWHRASLRVIEKLGMRRVGSRDHEILGELLIFERARESGVVEAAQNLSASAQRK